MTRALVIINANSRSGRESRDRVIDLLRDAGLELEVPVLHSPDDISPLVYAHRDKVDALVLGGGDGTLQNAAQVLAETRLTLGIIPLGTANDLARTLGIPSDIEQACRVIAAGHASPVDLGRVNGHYFFNVANIGLGVEVQKALTASAGLKRKWGALSYARAALDAYRRQKPFSVRIEAGEERYVLRVVQVAVGNGCYYGGGMLIHQSCSIRDQNLDCYAIRPFSWRAILRLCHAIKWGKELDSAEFLQLRGPEISIRTSKPRAVTADGEIITRTPAKFSVAAAAVNVYVPKDGET